MLNILPKKEKTGKKAGRVRGWSCPIPGFSLVLEAPLTGEELEGLPQGGHTSGKVPGGLVPSPRLPRCDRPSGALTSVCCFGRLPG